MSHTRGAASSSFENLSPVSQAAVSSRPRRTTTYREASDSESPDDHEQGNTGANVGSRYPKRNIGSLSSEFNTPMNKERDVKRLRSSRTSQSRGLSPDHEPSLDSGKNLRRSSRQQTHALMDTSKDNVDVNDSGIDVSDVNSEDNEEEDEADAAKVYSFRDRSLTKRETMNVQNLGGDGDGYRRNPNSSTRRSDRLADSTEKEVQPSRDYRYKQRLPSGGKIPNPAYHRDLKQHRNNRYDKAKRRGGEQSSRRHFDSSSESSDSDGGSRRPNRNSAPNKGGYNQYGNEDQQFHTHERKRLDDELNSIQPLKMSGDACSGMGGSIQDKHSQRDLSRADVLPVAVDGTIGFDQVGGLDHHIMQLKEMVVLPLMYPEVFTHFATQPPRGVLFVGPPGTGKTLTARALANSLVQGNADSQGAPGGPGNSKKVSFFMRKGADCLSKWVGEGERQLRLLFEQVRNIVRNIVYVGVVCILHIVLAIGSSLPTIYHIL